MGEASPGAWTHDEIDAVYAELTDMDVELDPDPIRFGPKRLNGKVAGCKRLVSRCTEIEINLAHSLAVLTRTMRAGEAELELRLQDMLANDPEVRAGRSVRDREAIASTKVRDERRSLTMTMQQVEDIKSSIAVVRAKKNDLKDTQGRLRDQIRLCHEEIALGSMWGSEAHLPASMRLRTSGAGVQSEGDSVDKLIEELTVPTPLEDASDEDAPSDDGIGLSDTSNGDSTEAPAGEAQQMYDAILSNLPDSVEDADKESTPTPPTPEDADVGAFDLDALIDGDW
jgi:hypothetical protein